MNGSPKQLADANIARARTFLREARRAAEGFEYQVHATAQRFSSGGVSTAQLAAGPPGLNHPYGIGAYNRRGRRGPVPYGDAGIINQQTGQFKASWDATSDVRVDGITVVCFNTAPYAAFLHTGTNKMRPRPIAAKILQAERGHFILIIADARRRALS